MTLVVRNDYGIAVGAIANLEIQFLTEIQRLYMLNVHNVVFQGDVQAGQHRVCAVRTNDFIGGIYEFIRFPSRGNGVGTLQLSKSD